SVRLRETSFLIQASLQPPFYRQKLAGDEIHGRLNRQNVILEGPLRQLVEVLKLPGRGQEHYEDLVRIGTRHVERSRRRVLQLNLPETDPHVLGIAARRVRRVDQPVRDLGDPGRE